MDPDHATIHMTTMSCDRSGLGLKERGDLEGQNKADSGGVERKTEVSERKARTELWQSVIESQYDYDGAVLIPVGKMTMKRSKR